MTNEILIYLSYLNLPTNLLPAGRQNGFQVLAAPALRPSQDWIDVDDYELILGAHVDKFTWRSEPGPDDKRCHIHVAVYTGEDITRAMGMQICAQGLEFASEAGLWEPRPKRGRQQ